MKRLIHLFSKEVLIAFMANILYLATFQAILAFLGIREPRIIIASIAALILVIIGLVILIVSRNAKKKNRNVDHYDNEDDAQPAIGNLIKGTTTKLCIISKAGTTIFDLFSDYADLLKNDKIKVELILMDPEDKQLATLDNSMMEIHDVKAKWGKMINKFEDKLHAILSSAEKLEFSNEDRGTLNDIVAQVRGAGDFKTLAYASYAMWRFTEHYVDRLTNKATRTEPLEIYASRDYPNVKAWLSDDKDIAIGHYTSHDLGRNSPIAIYKTNSDYPDNNEEQRLTYLNQLWQYKKDHLCKPFEHN
jgi:cytochrome oxidase Cu insertion factor (SCO1/SenC/PrrC family)